MKNNIQALLAVSILFLGLAFLASSADSRNKNSAFKVNSVSDESPVYYSFKTPGYMDFAGEQVPLHIDDVKERFERELLVTAYRHSNTFLMLKRKTRWFPVIEPILAQEGVPDDFKYLCVAESALSMTAVSPAGAKGPWQFLSSTGKSYGLEVNSLVDERYHMEKSTRAACKYLKQAKAKFGNWSAAAASYNMGVSGLNKQINRQQERDYYDLLLNNETSLYVFRILAFKEVLSNPAAYGFIIDSQDQYRPYVYNEVMLDSDVSNFADFAKRHNTNYKTLKILNPWLRDSYLKVPAGKTYRVKVPL